MKRKPVKKAKKIKVVSNLRLNTDDMSMEYDETEIALPQPKKRTTKNNQLPSIANLLSALRAIRIPYVDEKTHPVIKELRDKINSLNRKFDNGRQEAGYKAKTKAEREYDKLFKSKHLKSIKAIDDEIKQLSTLRQKLFDQRDKIKFNIETQGATPANIKAVIALAKAKKF